MEIKQEIMDKILGDPEYVEVFSYIPTKLLWKSAQAAQIHRNQTEEESVFFVLNLFGKFESLPNEEFEDFSDAVMKRMQAVNLDKSLLIILTQPVKYHAALVHTFCCNFNPNVVGDILIKKLP